jgi:hypothetical protein
MTSWSSYIHKLTFIIHFFEQTQPFVVFIPGFLSAGFFSRTLRIRIVEVLSNLIDTHPLDALVLRVLEVVVYMVGTGTLLLAR